MSDLYIYNSLTRQKEKFEPIVPGHVGLYVCGPTVSGESHFGHARPYVTFDVVYRYLIYLGYKVRYVRNITDAGHFEEEGREARDKVSEKAQIEKLEPLELTHKYTLLFRWAMNQFNNLSPNIEPLATAHIIEQIEMIEMLIGKGYAYERNGSIYFNVKKYAKTHDYGKLSGKILEDLLKNTRTLANQSEKEDAVDFALWKKAPPEHILRWKSPWGEGFPGWHIECSAMSTKYLGTQFDIHGGGMDLKFPHHESEIAQSTIANGCIPVKYWMHNNMITINGKKMGKSYNNVITLSELFSGKHELLERPYHPMIIRFAILQTHYSSTIDFSNEALQAAEKGLQRLIDAAVLVATYKTNNETTTNLTIPKLIEEKFTGVFDAINDDFSTARALAHLFDVVGIINAINDGHCSMDVLTVSSLNQLKTLFSVVLFDILGLKPIQKSDNEQLDGVMHLLLDIRKEVRGNKDFATSDLIRDRLQSLGIQIKDEKDGKSSYKLI